MTRDTKTQAEGFAHALRKLEQPRHFKGAPANFWNGLLEAMTQISGARTGVALRRPTSANGTWHRVAAWPPAQPPDAGTKTFTLALEELADSALAESYAVRFLEVSTDCAIGVRFGSDSGPENWVGAFHLPGCSQAESKAATTLLRLMQDTPAVCIMHSSVHQLQLKLSQFSSVMDLMALLNAQSHFMAVTMTLSNELAARHKCDRVSLGWLEHEYVRLQAISHTERFEKKMEAVKALE